MIMSLEPIGEEQEKFRANFKIISSSFAFLPFKIPGTAFYRGIQATIHYNTKLLSVSSFRNSFLHFNDDQIHAWDRASEVLQLQM